jgi:hypothetical protein
MEHLTFSEFQEKLDYFRMEIDIGGEKCLFKRRDILGSRNGMFSEDLYSYTEQYNKPVFLTEFTVFSRKGLMSFCFNSEGTRVFPS